MSSLIITNIGEIVSGKIEQPILAGDTIVVKDKKIAAIGGAELIDQYPGLTVVDANQTTVVPGLIDSHVHPVIGDFTPRQKTLDFIDSSLHGGVTTMISAGEAHWPGRPKDPAGVKALAVVASKSYKNARPSGVKVHAGAVILEPGLTEGDFAELAANGVWLVGEIGLGGVKKPADAAPMVEWAKKHGFKVQMHCGGTSIPGSSTVTADDVMQAKPTVVSHINGGPTAIAPVEVDKLIDTTDMVLEIVQCGNPKVADHVAKRLKEKGQLGRMIFGNDSPSGTGIIPLGILRTMCQIASVSLISGAETVAMATGNTARTYGLPVGVIEAGKEADLVIMDAPMGSIGGTAMQAIEAGDVPGVSMVIIDGEIKAKTSRNTPPAARMPKVK